MNIIWQTLIPVQESLPASASTAARRKSQDSLNSDWQSIVGCLENVSDTLGTLGLEDPRPSA